MERLFKHDFCNTEISDKVSYEHEAKAVVIGGGGVLLLYSAQEKCYFFPTVAIAASEEPCDADIVKTWLCETVDKVCGVKLDVKEAEEYGETQRSNADGTVITRTEYYVWKLTDDELTAATDMRGKEDDGDKEEKTGTASQTVQGGAFAVSWFAPFNASYSNRYARTEVFEKNLIRQERDVLDRVDLTVRRDLRIRHERDTIRSLGHPEYFEMLEFVGHVLGDTNTENIAGKVEISYSRFEHTKRVLGWAIRLYNAAPDKDKLRFDDIMTATIFHDVGRNAAEEQHIPHAAAGVSITKKYLEEHGYAEERIEYICMLVARHSDKNIMFDEGVDRGLLLLMEADLLDDMGAQGIVMDCMITEVRNPDAHFTDCLDHIMRFTQRIQQYNPMATEEGRKMWDEKTELVDRFVDALSADTVL